MPTTAICPPLLAALLAFEIPGETLTTVLTAIALATIPAVYVFLRDLIRGVKTLATGIEKIAASIDPIMKHVEEKQKCGNDCERSSHHQN